MGFGFNIVTMRPRSAQASLRPYCLKALLQVMESMILVIKFPSPHISINVLAMETIERRMLTMGRARA